LITHKHTKDKGKHIVKREKKRKEDDYEKASSSLPPQEFPLDACIHPIFNQAMTVDRVVFYKSQS
jgi:hypothetical protein